MNQILLFLKLNLRQNLTGNYWHSTKYRNKTYHLNKTIECEKIGYRLIHIFEHELTEFDFKSFLIQIFNGNEKIPKKIWLPRTRYSTLENEKYELSKPELIKFKNCEYYNCGKIKYE